MKFRRQESGTILEGAFTRHADDYHKYYLHFQYLSSSCFIFLELLPDVMYTIILLIFSISLLSRERAPQFNVLTDQWNVVYHLSHVLFQLLYFSHLTVIFIL